jgi:beta-lactamase regulating signal transducer with metallopeptidase domain
VNPAPTLDVWLGLLLALAAGTTVIVGLAALLARVIQAAVWQRTLWQASTVGLAIFCLSEVSGFTAGAAQWIARPFVNAQPTSASGGEGESSAPAAAPAASFNARVQIAPDVGRRPGDRGSTLAGAGEVSPLVDQAASMETPLPPSLPQHLSLDDQSGILALNEAGVWWPGLIWLLGTILVAGRLLTAWVLLAVFRRRCRATADAALGERIRVLAERVGLRRRFAVIETSGLCGPVTFGLLRPALVLPAGFVDDLDPDKQEAVLAHELAHLAGRDPAWHLLADLVAAALWWQPLTWWSRRRLHAANEAAADEACQVVAGGPAALASCLVDLAGRLLRPRRAGWVPMQGSGFRSALGRRVERLVRLKGEPWQRPGRLRRCLTFTLGLAVLILIAVLSSAWAHPQAISQGDLSMVTLQQTWKHSLAGFILCAALGPGVDAAVAADDAQGPTSQGAPERVTDETPVPDAKAEGPAATTKPSDDTGPTVTPASLALGTLKRGEDVSKKVVVRAAKPFRITTVRVSNGQLTASVPDKGSKRTHAVTVSFKPRQVPGKFQATVHLMTDLKAEGEVKFAVTAEVVAPANPASAMGALYGGQVGASQVPGTRVRVFRLSYRDPVEVREVLQEFDREERPVMLGSQRGFCFSPRLQPFYVAVDPRTRSLIVRGSEQNLEMMADLVALLDLPPGKPLPKTKNLQAFRLRFADVGSAYEVLSALNIRARIAKVPKSKLLIVAGLEGEALEIAEVIEALDMEVHADKKAN